MVDTIIIEKHFLALLTTDGFNLKFDDMLVDYKHPKECYEALEVTFQSIFGKPRYKDYESFRVVRSRWINKT